MITTFDDAQRRYENMLPEDYEVVNSEYYALLMCIECLQIFETDLSYLDETDMTKLETVNCECYYCKFSGDHPIHKIICR